MPTPDSKKRLYNPDNPAQWIDVRIIDRLNLQHGSGPVFQKRLNKYENKEPIERKVHTKTVTHKAENEDGSPNFGDSDDPSQRIVVEVIEKFSTTHGSGPTYQRNIFTLDHNKDTNGRKVHRRRVFGADSESYFDIERTDEFTLTHGSGINFRREIIKLNWDDADFDTRNVPLWDRHPNEGFDPPWRLDPFQNIVNVKWGGDPTPFEFINQFCYSVVVGGGGPGSRYVDGELGVDTTDPDVVLAAIIVKQQGIWGARLIVEPHYTGRTFPPGCHEYSYTVSPS